MVHNEKVDEYASANMLEAEAHMKRYSQEPTFNTKKALIEFSRDVIYQYINDFNNTNSKRK